MNTFGFMYDKDNQEAFNNLQEAERLMNLSLTKIQTACKLDLPLRRSLLISSVLNRAQKAAADAIASLDCSNHTLKSVEHTHNNDIEMHILGQDLLSEILCTDEKIPISKNLPIPSTTTATTEVERVDYSDLSDNLRKRPRESITTLSDLQYHVDSSNNHSVSGGVDNELLPLSNHTDHYHDSKRLKEDEAVSEYMESWSNQPQRGSGNNTWLFSSIWTTPVVC